MSILVSSKSKVTAPPEGWPMDVLLRSGQYMPVTQPVIDGARNGGAELSMMVFKMLGIAIYTSPADWSQEDLEFFYKKFKSLTQDEKEGLIGTLDLFYGNVWINKIGDFAEEEKQDKIRQMQQKPTVVDEILEKMMKKSMGRA